MAQPAGAQDDESRADSGFDYNRTVALSDGVFAIALTLLVLNIALPATGAHRDLGSALLEQGTEYESYAIGFAVIALLWVRHHAFFRSLERIDTLLTVLNLVYLGFVAFLPYPTRVLGRYGGEPASVVLYAITVAIIALIGAVMRAYTLRAGLRARELRQSAREHLWIPPAVFLASIPIAFLNTKAAELFWLVMLLPRLSRRITGQRG